jgi:transposase
MNIIPPPGRRVGAGPLFRQIADDIGLVEMVNRQVRWDDRQCRVSPGERILMMVLDVLIGRSPLYRVTERWMTVDVAVLAGAGRVAADFTDDSLGRALDKLGRAQPARVFSAVAAQAYVREHISLESSHWDSTSCSLTGDYPQSDEAAVKPAHGHSKAHRPDLKQLLLTLFVNRDGVPLFGTVESGQRSDKTLNGEMLDRLVEAMAPEQLAQLIYVADSALVTGPNLTRLATQQIAFVSRCPETFGVVGQVKEQAWIQDAWTPLPKFGQRRDAAQYWASEHQAMIEERSYRLVVYRSSALDRRRVHGLDREISQSRTAMEAAAKALEQERFACEEDATTAWSRWQKDWQQAWHFATATIRSEVQYTRPGRPRKVPQPGDTTEVWMVEIAIGAVRQERKQQEIERRGTLVLITNVPQERLSSAELLREYKSQTSVERHFHFVKDPLFVDGWFLKKAERLEALGYVILLACLLYSLLERRLRRSALPIPSPSRRMLTHPTGHEIVRHLESLQIVPDPDGHRQIALEPALHATFTAVMEALDMDATVFTTPPNYGTLTS